MVVVPYGCVSPRCAQTLAQECALGAHRSRCRWARGATGGQLPGLQGAGLGPAPSPGAASEHGVRQSSAHTGPGTAIAPSPAGPVRAYQVSVSGVAEWLPCLFVSQGGPLHRPEEQQGSGQQQERSGHGGLRLSERKDEGKCNGHN